MLNWKYWALAVSSATTLMVVGIALHTAGCGVSIAEVDALKGPCDLGDAGTDTRDAAKCECQKDSDCPSNFCTIATCVANHCGVLPNPSRNEMPLPADEQIVGDCHMKRCNLAAIEEIVDLSDNCDQKVCNSAGECVECNVDGDCTNGYCHQSVCASCSNQMMDGNETDVDCGNTPCGLCNGTTCPAAPAKCKSGICADGFCCDDTCNGTCQACNLLGKEGSCTNVVAGDQDPSCNTTNKACDSMGMCQVGTINGDTCAKDSNCISNKCTAPDGGVGVCVSP